MDFPSRSRLSFVANNFLTTPISTAVLDRNGHSFTKLTLRKNLGPRVRPDTQKPRKTSMYAQRQVEERDRETEHVILSLVLLRRSQPGPLIAISATTRPAGTKLRQSRQQRGFQSS